MRINCSYRTHHLSKLDVAKELYVMAQVMYFSWFVFVFHVEWAYHPNKYWAMSVFLDKVGNLVGSYIFLLRVFDLIFLGKWLAPGNRLPFEMNIPISVDSSPFGHWIRIWDSVLWRSYLITQHLRINLSLTG